LELAAEGLSGGSLKENNRETANVLQPKVTAFVSVVADDVPDYSE